jgi:hypothetical protein
MGNNALHALLAVEGDLSQQAKNIMGEAINTFNKKSDHFDGITKVYIPFNDGEELVPPETKEVVTTVKEKLDYVKNSVIKALDAKLSKEETNSSGTAISELKVGDTVFGTFSATGYLALGRMLEALRAQYLAIPTLDPTRVWTVEKQSGRNLYQAGPEVKYRTVKKTKVITLAPPTDKHPAQTQLVQDESQVGKYDTIYTSGRLSPGEKSALLTKLDELILAVKMAKERANQVEAKQVKIGEAIFEFIHGAPIFNFPR